MRLLKVILCFSLIFFFSYPTYFTRYDDNTNNIKGTVISIKKGDRNTYIVRAKEKVLLYSSNLYQIGDIIDIKGSLMLPNKNTIFNTFNYQNYLLSKKVFYTITSDDIVLIKNNNNFFYKIKNKLYEKIINPYIKAFILGDVSDINEAVTNSFRINGISHLLAISGSQISLFATIILFILNKINKNINRNYIIVIAFLIFYMFITSFTASVVRSTIMFILLFLNKTFKLNIKPIYILTFILICCLLYNPYYIYDLGFVFSYSISASLIIFNKIYSKTNYLIQTLLISLIAFLVCIPIQINNYYEINPLSIIYNIFFVPFISFIIYPLSLITFILPFLTPIFNFLIKVFEFISLKLATIPTTIILKKMPIYITIIYYIIIIIILYLLTKKKYYSLIIMPIIIFIHYNINYLEQDAYLTMLDVKQGDSTLLSLPHNSGNILIDTGGSSYYTFYKNIINYLKSEGIHQINYLILTHGDYDHIGEAIDLINNFKIKNVIFNSGNDNDLETKIITLLNQKEINYQKYNLNKLLINKYTFDFINCKSNDNENEDSLVIYTIINNYKLLFMGDATINNEEQILKKGMLRDIDIIKIGHHGSNGSTSNNLINKIKPKIALISVAKKNLYHHPSQRVIKLLEDNKIRTYLTSQNGSIKVILNKQIKIVTIN